MSRKRLNLAPPFAKYRNVALKHLKKPFAKLPPKARLALAFGFFVVTTTLLIVNPYSQSVGDVYKEGDIVRQVIVSPADIIETDDAETAKWREAATQAVKPIFLFEANRAEQSVLSFRSAWEDLRRQYRNVFNSNSDGDATKAELNWTGYGGNEVAKIIETRNFNANDLQLLSEVLREAADGYIYDDTDAQLLESEITVVDRRKLNQQSTLQMPQSNMSALSAAREKVRTRLGAVANFTAPEKEVFYQALMPLVLPSVTFDRVLTEQMRANAANSVPPAQVLLKRNQVIAREGDTVTPQMLSQLAAVRAYGQSTRKFNRFLGVLFIVAAFFWIVRKYIQHRSTKIKLILSTERTFALVGLAVLIQTLLMAIGFILADFVATENIRPPLNDATTWALVIPFASAALLVALLVDAQIALVVAILTALVAGLIAPRGVEFAIYAAISSSMAVYGFARYQSRQSVTFAGLLIGLVNAAVGVALMGYTQQPFILNSVLLILACGMLGGIVAAAVTAVLIPIFESLFGILTDIKLLELSNADLPVLGQLALRAPGTNQHSHAVGQIAENACRAINANPLLGRIGALYHDIGKLAAPDHFIENQHGTNPHDRLKPLQSAKIVVSHVTYGIKLGREIGLPERIIDFIAQHHGTRTLHYFLNKAQAAAEESCQNGCPKTVCEADFRYPGPKPQFKETAVLMIADSCEAAVRSLDQPTPEDIRIIVDKIVDTILADNQFDECDLTLRELTQIRESVICSLAAIYHCRIDYPGFNPPKDFKPMANGNGKVEAEVLLKPEESEVLSRQAEEVSVVKTEETI